MPSTYVPLYCAILIAVLQLLLAIMMSLARVYNGLILKDMKFFTSKKFEVMQRAQLNTSEYCGIFVAIFLYKMNELFFLSFFYEMIE